MQFPLLPLDKLAIRIIMYSSYSILLPHCQQESSSFLFYLILYYQKHERFKSGFVLKKYCNYPESADVSLLLLHHFQSQHLKVFGIPLPTADLP